MRRIVALLGVLVACAFLCSTAGAASCPPGHSQMGCSLPRVVKGISAPPKGEIVPDVSSYQRTVNWPDIKAWQLQHGWKLTGGIFKLGEYVLDPYALQNAEGLRAAGMLAVGYVFVRPGLEAATVIGWTRDAGIKVLVLDEEVSGIEGTAARITPDLKVAGLTVVDYHAQGNVLDSSADGMLCWTADLGPSIRPDCTTGPTVGWQFSWYGSIPGIDGQVDESISYGLLKLAEPPAKTVCFGSGATPRSAKCKPIERHYDWLIARHRFWQSQFGRCVRYADGIDCAHALYWDRLRGTQAVKLRAKYTR